MRVKNKVEYEAAAAHIVLLGARFTCTKCRKTKAAAQFGLRKMGNGTIRNQAQCSKCRSIK